MSNFTDFNALARNGCRAAICRNARSGTRRRRDDPARFEDDIAGPCVSAREGFQSVLRDHVRRGGEWWACAAAIKCLDNQLPIPMELRPAADTGLELLPTTTVLARDKITEQVEGRFQGNDFDCPGISDSVGRTDRKGSLLFSCEERPVWKPAAAIVRDEECLDGAVRPDGLVWGNVCPMGSSINRIFAVPG